MNVWVQEGSRLRFGAALALAAFLLGSCSSSRNAGGEPDRRRDSSASEAETRADLPSGFQQLLPRGRIAAVDNPQFVAAEAAEIPDDAWVLGIVVDGQARAYSLNLLNRHEVVNDRINEKSFAAVW